MADAAAVTSMNGTVSQSSTTARTPSIVVSSACCDR
jgi:hypothetical protein